MCLYSFLYGSLRVCVWVVFLCVRRMHLHTSVCEREVGAEADEVR